MSLLLFLHGSVDLKSASTCQIRANQNSKKAAENEAFQCAPVAARYVAYANVEKKRM